MGRLIDNTRCKFGASIQDPVSLPDLSRIFCQLLAEVQFLCAITYYYLLSDLLIYPTAWLEAAVDGGLDTSNGLSGTTRGVKLKWL